nr:hypothetical protein Iba_chr03cCG4190 [Ipomoea batatas]
MFNISTTLITVLVILVECLLYSDPNPTNGSTPACSRSRRRAPNPRRHPCGDAPTASMSILVAVHVMGIEMETWSNALKSPAKHVGKGGKGKSMDTQWLRRHGQMLLRARRSMWVKVVKATCSLVGTAARLPSSMNTLHRWVHSLHRIDSTSMNTNLS